MYIVHFFYIDKLINKVFDDVLRLTYTVIGMLIDYIKLLLIILLFNIFIRLFLIHNIV